jgi:hypothetical protein
MRSIALLLLVVIHRISRLFEGLGVFTSKSSVERLLKNLPPYTVGRLVG